MIQIAVPEKQSGHFWFCQPTLDLYSTVTQVLQESHGPLEAESSDGRSGRLIKSRLELCAVQLLQDGDSSNMFTHPRSLDRSSVKLHMGPAGLQL
jgi:hypothetical protein